MFEQLGTCVEYSELVEPDALNKAKDHRRFIPGRPVFAIHFLPAYCYEKTFFLA
jgi:hypothetical protein